MFTTFGELIKSDGDCVSMVAGLQYDLFRKYMVLLQRDRTTKTRSGSLSCGVKHLHPHGRYRHVEKTCKQSKTNRVQLRVHYSGVKASQFTDHLTDCLFQSLFQANGNKSKLCITGPLWWKPPATVGFPSHIGPVMGTAVLCHDVIKNCLADLVDVVGPGPKLHLARLIIKREVVDIEVTATSDGRRRAPHDGTVVRDPRFRFLGQLIFPVSATSVTSQIFCTKYHTLSSTKMMHAML